MQVNPKGEDEGKARVNRGVGYDWGNRICRSASRTYAYPAMKLVDMGFRIIMGVKQDANKS